MTVASPCNRVCILAAGTRICIGCQRSLEEIAAWGDMNDDGRRAVLARAAARRVGGAGVDLAANVRPADSRGQS